MPRTEKPCRGCKKTLPIEAFYPCSTNGRQSMCRACSKSGNIEWQARNRDKVNAYKRATRAKNLAKFKEAELNGNLKFQYGITAADYKRMLEHGGGRCWACGDPPCDRHRLQVDHDHETGEIRGLLCRKCNSATGYAKDSAKRLRACADYLENWRVIGIDVGVVAGRAVHRKGVREKKEA